MRPGLPGEETSMRIQDVIELMEARHAHFDPAARTCDGVIAGDPSAECAG